MPISLDPLANWRVKNRGVGLILGDFMLFKLLRNYTLVLTVAALASVTGGILAACSDPTARQPDAGQNPGMQETARSGGHDGHGEMHHGGMDHSTMDLGPADAEYDLRFIDAMIPHHEGAIAMAQEAQEKSQRPEIQQLSQEIIAAQEQEIAQLRQWRQTWYPDADETPIAYNPEMGHSMPMTEEQRQSMMMSMDLGPADAEFDRRFMQVMIPHHEGAVVMAQDALGKTQRPEIRQLSQEIIAAQEQEIAQMQQWKQQW